MQHQRQVLSFQALAYFSPDRANHCHLTWRTRPSNTRCSDFVIVKSTNYNREKDKEAANAKKSVKTAQSDSERRRQR